MIRVEASIVIDRPVDEVFAFMTDHRNDVRWQEGLLEVQVSPDGSVGAGTQITAVRKFLSRRTESTIEISEFLPNRKETFRTVTGSFDVNGCMLYEAKDGSTVVIQHLEMDTRGHFAFADLLVASSLRRNLTAGLGDLKDLLEGRVALPG